MANVRETSIRFGAALAVVGGLGASVDQAKAQQLQLQPTPAINYDTLPKHASSFTGIGPGDTPTLVFLAKNTTQIDTALKKAGWKEANGSIKDEISAVCNNTPDKNAAVSQEQLGGFGHFNKLAYVKAENPNKFFPEQIIRIWPTDYQNVYQATASENIGFRSSIVGSVCNKGIFSAGILPVFEENANIDNIRNSVMAEFKHLGYSTTYGGTNLGENKYCVDQLDKKVACTDGRKGVITFYTQTKAA